MAETEPDGGRAPVELQTAQLVAAAGDLVHDVLISNDSDFGLAGSTGDQPPFGLAAKLQPNGGIDDGGFLVIERR